MVHSGFLAAYDSVRAKVLSLVDTLTRDASPGDPWVVFVTGHSLGGALATLCAYEMAGRRWVWGGGGIRVRGFLSRLVSGCLKNELALPVRTLAVRSTNVLLNCFAEHKE